jgi:hypothetical protein
MELSRERLRTMTAMDDEGKAIAPRQACWEYDARRRDIETKFETELSTLGGAEHSQRERGGRR